VSGNLFFGILFPFLLFQGRSDMDDCSNFLPEQLQMLVHDLGFALGAILITFRILNILDLRSLVQLINPEAEEPSEFVEEFFENEFGVDFALAVSRKFTKHVSVPVIQQEIIAIVYPFEVHVERDFFVNLLLKALAVVEHPQQ
jgi:hypothetical protein